MGRPVLASPFASGQLGNAIVTSDQPLNILVTEAAAQGGSNVGTAYSISSQTGTTLYDPIALNGNFGGFDTNAIIYNPGTTCSYR